MVYDFFSDGSLKVGSARVGAAELRATASSSYWYSNLNFYSSNDNDLNYTWNAGPVLKDSANSLQRYHAGSTDPQSML